jgi:hypothetical protein
VVVLAEFSSAGLHELFNDTEDRIADSLPILSELLKVVVHPVTTTVSTPCETRVEASGVSKNAEAYFLTTIANYLSMYVMATMQSFAKP